MAYAKQTWISRVRQYANRKLLVPTGNANEYDETQVEGTITTAGTPFTATRMNNIEEGIYSIDGPSVRSAIQSTYGAVLSMPASTKNGLIRGTLSGMTLNNAVVNGDFSSGTTGWTGTNTATFTVSSGTASFTASALDGRISRTVPSILKDRKYFAIANVKATSSLVSLRLSNLVDYEPFVSHTGSGNYETLKAIFDFTGKGVSTNGSVRILDGRASAWNSIDVKNIMVIDMTALGLESLTADQMKDLCDNGYFEGLKGSDVECVSVGKNLFDEPHSIPDFTTVQNLIGMSYYQGLLTINGGSNYTILKSKFLKVKPNTSYTLSIDGYGDASAYKRIEIRNSQDAVVSFLTLPTTRGVTSITFNTGLNTEVRVQYYATTTVSGSIYVYSALLELGSTATAYEPFKQSTLSLDKVLNRVPNGVADNYALDTGALTQNVSDVYTLVAGDVTLMDTSNANIDVALSVSPLRSDISLLGNDTFKTGTFYVSNWFETTYTGRDSASNIGGIYKSASSGGLRFIFAKGTTLAQAQTALAGTKILYQLATPVTTDYNRSLLSFENGTLYDNGLLPTYKQITTPTNVAGNLEDSIVIDAMFSEMIGDLDDSTTTNKTSVIGITNEILASNPLKFYGKYSLATGGSAVSASGSNVSGYVSYSVESKDDFNAINIAGAPTKITIPSGVTLARFYFSGLLSVANASGTSASVVVYLYKNGVSYEELGYSRISSNVSTSNSSGNVSFGWTEPIVCTPGDYFEIYVTCTVAALSSASLSANSKFGMEVLG